MNLSSRLESLKDRHASLETRISDEDPGFQDTSTGCDPGPDSDLEDLILPEDRVPAGPAPETAHPHETAKDA